MVIDIKVTQDLKNIERRLTKAQRKVIPQAATSAINRTAKSVKSLAIKTVSKQTGAQNKVVKTRIDERKATRATLTATLLFKKRAINLILFVAKAKRVPGAFRAQRGVKAKTKKLRVFAGTFIGTGSGGQKKLVFRRTTDSRRPIEAVPGPNITARLRSKKLRKILDIKGRLVFDKELDRQLTFRLKKLKLAG